MSEPNLNDERYEERLGFARELVSNRLGFNDTTIITLAYSHNVPFAFNNFLYTITLATPTQAPAPPSAAPDTTPIPSGTRQLILRLTNAHPATGLNNANRVQNEVAGAAFARSALVRTPYAHIVPEIYDWEAGDGIQGGEQGWILMQFKQGVNGEEKSWSEIPEGKQEVLIGELADVFAALKAHPLPEGVDGIGGLTYDKEGKVVLGEMTLWPGGPYEDYTDMWGGMLDNALKDADDSPVLRGWRDNDLRARIDKYRRDGLKAEINSLDLDKRLVYSHSDYGTGNVLFDPVTFKLTALLDFDWGYIGYQYDDFLRTLNSVKGGFPCGVDSELDGEEAALQQAMLSGFTEESILADIVEDRVARQWDEALENRAVVRPRKLKGIKELCEVKWFCDNVAPFRLIMAPMVRRLGEENVRKEREAVREMLDAWLRRRGY